MTSDAFGGTVAAFYERFMVPLVFDPYAEDLARRLSAEPVEAVLEVAAGTGIVTRKLTALRANRPKTIVATDLSQAMLDLAARLCPASEVTWLQADAMALPFPDASFDRVVCQFGAMFFPDRARAYREARRVLRPGGRFLFSVWDRIETSELAATAQAAVAALFPDDPPTFMSRVPHGYFDRELIAADVRQAGFDEPSIETVVEVSRAASAHQPARAFVQGTPLRAEIEKRDASMLEQAVAAAEHAFVQRYGDGPIEGSMRAFVIEARR